MEEHFGPLTLGKTLYARCTTANSILSAPGVQPQRRIDDKLLALCAKAQGASDGELEAVRKEYLSLLRQKIERLQGRAATLLLKTGPLEPERRSTDPITNSERLPDQSSLELPKS